MSEFGGKSLSLSLLASQCSPPPHWFRLQLRQMLCGKWIGKGKDVSRQEDLLAIAVNRDQPVVIMEMWKTWRYKNNSGGRTERSWWFNWVCELGKEFLPEQPAESNIFMELEKQKKDASWVGSDREVEPGKGYIWNPPAVFNCAAYLWPHGFLFVYLIFYVMLSSLLSVHFHAHLLHFLHPLTHLYLASFSSLNVPCPTSHLSLCKCLPCLSAFLPPSSPLSMAHSSVSRLGHRFPWKPSLCHSQPPHAYRRQCFELLLLPPS